MAAKSFGAFTEVSDAVECAWSGLPEKFRKREQAKRHGKKPQIHVKMQQVYQNADKLDVGEVVKCLILEQLKDYAIGKAAKKHAETRKEFGIRGGYLSRLAKIPSVDKKRLTENEEGK